MPTAGLDVRWYEKPPMGGFSTGIIRRESLLVRFLPVAVYPDSRSQIQDSNMQ